jgi:hypothetical protein
MKLKSMFKQAAILVAMLSCSVQAASITKIVNGSFDKPVIFVEGYDPDNKYSFSYYQVSLGASFFNDLKSSGKDFVFVNFDNGGAAIESNANELTNAIGLVNSQKVGSHPNAVIGFSMGGLVSRWALKDMENRGINHQTSLYISYDAPHRGANIPYDIKTNLDHIHSKVKKYTAGYINVDRDSIYSPAGKQMIMWGDNTSTFYRALENKGYPRQLRRVAFANGSSTNRTLGLFNGQLALDYKYEILQVRQYRKSLKSNNMRVCRYPCNPVGYSLLDNVAGSTTGSFAGFKAELIANDDNLFDVDIYSDNTDNMIHSFIPTVSALDLKGYDYNEDISSSSLRYNHSPFDKTYVGSVNYPHTSFSQWRSYINYELNNYHQTGTAVPSRSHKALPIGDVGNIRTEWVRSGNYILDWPTVPGASHYEIYKTSQYNTMFGSNPVKTVTVNHTFFNVSSTSKIAIRACNIDKCGYPRITTLVKRSDNLNPL